MTPENEDDLATLFGVFARLVQSQAGRTIPEGLHWINDAQVLAVKFYRHIASMQGVRQPTGIQSGETALGPFVDHSSVNVIVRAALETYLTFSHIYGGDNRSISEFRHTIWRYGGLIDRQSFTASTPANKKKLTEEKESIAALAAEIQQNEEWFNYSKDARNRILKGEWRAGKGWIAIATDAGFHKKHISEVYSYLCGYSHSSWLSAIQIRDAAGSVGQQRAMADTFVRTALVLLSFFVNGYVTLFPDSTERAGLTPPEARIQLRWHLTAAKMARMYEAEGH